MSDNAICEPLVVVTAGRNVKAMARVTKVQASMLLNLVDTCQPSELRQTLTSLLQDPNVKEVCLEQKTTGGLHVSEKIVLTRRLLNLVLQAVSAENSQGLSNLKHDLTRIITGTNNDQILFPHLTADGM